MKTIFPFILILFTGQMLHAQAPSLTYIGSVKQYDNGVEGVSLTQPVAFSPDGKNFYVGAYDGFTWYTVDVPNNTAALGGWLQDASGDGDPIEGDGSGGAGVSDGHGVIVSPDGKHIYYAAGAGEHSVTLYNRDVTTGAPTYVSIIRDGDMGISNLKYPYGVAMDSNGDNLYVACKDWDGNSVVWFDRNSTDGSLTYNSKLVDGVGGIEGLGNASHVTVSPDNKNVYVVGFGDDAVSWYTRDLMNGDLTQAGYIVDGTSGVNSMMDPYWVIVSSDGKHVYVSSQADASITIFDRDLANGTLTYNNTFTDAANLITVRGINLTPNGLLMVASAGDKQVLLQRDPNTGGLTLLSFIENNVGGVQHIGGSRYSAISPNAAMFVATAYTEGAVAWFELDQGALSIDGDQRPSLFICLSSGEGNYTLAYNDLSVINTNVHYAITDMNGKIIIEEEIEHFNSLQIALGNYAKGCYALSIITQNRMFKYKLLNY